MLTQEQLSAFARNGFLQVKNMVDPKTCAELVDHTWTRMPPEWSRDDPDSWSGELSDSCHVADLRIRRGLLQFQKGDLIDNPVVTRAFSAQAIGGDLGRALLGAPLAAMRLRGLYAIIPLPETTPYSPFKKPHIESHAAQLIALCYLEDVKPGGGGLLVWPGSHRDIYPVMGSKLEHVSTPEYEEVFWRWAVKEPVELPGERGDVVIIHHRLLHAPSINRTRRIRYGFLCDYQRNDFRTLSTQPPGAMWEDWPAISALPRHLLDGPSDYVLKSQSDSALSVVDTIRNQALSLDHGESHPSSIRKGDASVLARSRREGDLWILLSDSPVTEHDTELFPRGSDLTEAGVEMLVNGQPVTSVCKYDIISKLEAIGPGDQIEVRGLDRPAWLRVLRIRLPFIRTEILAQKALQPGVTRLAFEDAPPKPKAAKAPKTPNPVEPAKPRPGLLDKLFQVLQP